MPCLLRLLVQGAILWAFVGSPQVAATADPTASFSAFDGVRPFHRAGANTARPRVRKHARPGVHPHRPSALHSVQVRPSASPAKTAASRFVVSNLLCIPVHDRTTSSP